MSTSAVLFAGELMVMKSALDYEKKSVDYLIDNYFQSRKTDDLRVRKKLRKRIKDWNKHVLDWRDLDEGMSIIAKKKTPDIDISFVRSAYNYQESFSDTSSKGTGIEFSLNMWLLYHYRAFGVFRYQQFNHLRSDSLEEYPETSTMSLEVGIKRMVDNYPNWFQYVSLDYESLGMISTVIAHEGMVYANKSFSKDTIESAKITMIYLKLGLEYHFDFFFTEKEGRFQFLYGYSLDGIIVTKDSLSEITVSGTKYFFSYQQYLYEDLWARMNFQSSHIMNDSASRYKNYYSSFNLGYTF